MIVQRTLILTMMMKRMAMASLALVVSLIFLSLIIIGPITYILASFSWMPNLVKYLLGLVCSLIGLWAIFIPVPLFKIFGLVNFSIGIKVLLAPKTKTTQA